MNRCSAAIVFTLFATNVLAQKNSKPVPKPVPVPEAAPVSAVEKPFQDRHNKVRFTVPRGWQMARKDGQVSTFHLDARSASSKAELRGLAIMDFNPFPYSTLAGALFYYSVEPKTTDAECAAQAIEPKGQQTDLIESAPESAAVPSSAVGVHKDTQDVAGVTFAHGHDEHGQVCIEARDEVYTAWHKHSCYRFDLAMNTFCQEGSGARPITPKQVQAVDQRLADILSSVSFGWEKTSPHSIVAPAAPEEKPRVKHDHTKSESPAS
jgi:hypothetical protein